MTDTKNAIEVSVPENVSTSASSTVTEATEKDFEELSQMAKLLLSRVKTARNWLSRRPESLNQNMCSLKLREQSGVDGISIERMATSTLEKAKSLRKYIIVPSLGNMQGVQEPLRIYAYNKKNNELIGSFDAPKPVSIGSVDLSETVAEKVKADVSKTEGAGDSASKLF